jgi:two-component system sensor histidine kinase EvgS
MMGGTLALHSQPGQGTQVQMMFELTSLEPVVNLAPLREIEEPVSATLDILVVDDHPANRLLLCQQLGFLGHRCDVAEHGAQGLERWLARHFDLVIVDCNMPVMNGYDLTRAIRNHEREHAQAPCTVLGFTANAQPEEKQRCRDAGMDDCLFKPISLTALNDRLSRVGARPALSNQIAEVPAFDMASIVALTGNRPEMIQHLISQLITSSRDDVAELGAVSAAGSTGAIKDVAHKIKGAARIISACSVIGLCEQLEEACDASASATIISGHTEALIKAMAALEQGLLKHQQPIS